MADTTNRLIRVRRAARQWAKEGAKLNPGIRFIALVDGQQHTAEIEGLSGLLGMQWSCYWLQDVELGFKDAAAGRWVWSDDLDRYTQLEDIIGTLDGIELGIELP